MKTLARICITLILFVGVGLIMSCGDDGPVRTPGDIYPPADILDLSQTVSRPHAITIQWTAPGDDSLYGIASAYEIRYSQTFLSETVWDLAFRCCVVPVPDTAGTTQSWEIDGLDHAGQYFFAIKTIDENGNSSGISNIASVRTSEDPLGQFGNRQSYEVGRGPASIVAEDVNSDGFLDLITGNSYTHDISVCINRGDGRFRSAQHYPAGFSVRSICLGDFNGDTRRDIAVACGYGDSVTVLRGRGTGEFDYMWSAVVADNPQGVAAGDFNHDGYCDLVVVSEGGNVGQVFFGNFFGTLSSEQTMSLSEYPHSLAAFDFDNDSFDDLIINCYSGVAELWHNDGHGAFTRTDSMDVFNAIRWSEPGDLDADGDLDLAVVGGISEMAVLLNNGQGQFTLLQEPALSFTTPTGVALADFDLDGDLDAAVSSYGSSVYTLRNTCDARLLRPVYRGFSDGSWAICTGDFDNDGDEDIAAADYKSRFVSVFLNNQIHD